MPARADRSRPRGCTPPRPPRAARSDRGGVRRRDDAERPLPQTNSSRPPRPRTPAGGECGRTTMEPVLELDGLTRRFGDVVALDGVSFGVERGRIFGFLGPNGAGKTTSMRIVAGI